MSKAFELLRDNLEYVNVTEKDNVIYIEGTTNKIGEMTCFISALKGYFWNDISKDTKIYIRGILIEITDYAQYGDIWGAKWFIDWFGSNISFENCHYARNDRIEDKGRFNTTHIVTIENIKKL